MEKPSCMHMKPRPFLQTTSGSCASLVFYAVFSLWMRMYAHASLEMVQEESNQN